jgi:hypothetical protein
MKPNRVVLSALVVNDKMVLAQMGIGIDPLTSKGVNMCKMETRVPGLYP